jgi:hypothetical protein
MVRQRFLGQGQLGESVDTGEAQFRTRSEPGPLSRELQVKARLSCSADVRTIGLIEAKTGLEQTDGNGSRFGNKPQQPTNKRVI